jgi:hypothetical protein
MTNYYAEFECLTLDNLGKCSIKYVVIFSNLDIELNRPKNFYDVYI